MGDLNFLRLPVGEGPVRVKFARAEWTPQKNKLILHPPIQWYCEQQPSQSGETADEVVMLDAADVTQGVTNPLRFTLQWGEKGRPPIRTMGTPPDGAQPVTPEQSKSRGGGNSGGQQRTMTKKQLDQAIAYSLNATHEVAEEIDGIDCGAVFAKVLGCAMFVDWPDENTVDENLAKIPGADGTEDSIPF